jgi:hypothetical protein
MSALPPKADIVVASASRISVLPICYPAEFTGSTKCRSLHEIAITRGFRTSKLGVCQKADKVHCSKQIGDRDLLPRRCDRFSDPESIRVKAQKHDQLGGSDACP